MATARRRIGYADERLDALLSITGRMDGFLYRCRNDASYTMLYMSDGVLTLTGFPSNDFLHNQVRHFSSIIHPEDLPGVYKAVDEALEQRRNWNVDYRIVSNTGKPLWVREIGGGVFSDAGVLTFLEGFIIDITDRKDVEDVNIQLLAELKEANEELSAQKRELELAKLQSDHSANHDALTGLPNRRAFHQRLSAAVELSARSTRRRSACSSSTSTASRTSTTLSDTIVATPCCSRSPTGCGACCAATTSWRASAAMNSHSFCSRDRTRSKTSRCSSPIGSSTSSGSTSPAPREHIPVGCTVGVATAPENAETADGLMAIADRLMYVGKKSGRCRVVTADEIDDDPVVRPFKASGSQSQNNR